MGDLSFYVSLQIKQLGKEIFINQGKIAKEMIKKFGMEKAKAFGTPMSACMCLEFDST